MGRTVEAPRLTSRIDRGACEYCQRSKGYWWDEYTNEWKCNYCNAVWSSHNGDIAPLNAGVRAGDALFQEVPEDVFGELTSRGQPLRIKAEKKGPEQRSYQEALIADYYGVNRSNSFFSAIMGKYL